MKKSSVKIGREFEEEAFIILKKRFDSVEWLSQKTCSSFDFKCMKDGKVYFGDAKLTNAKKPYLYESQKEADFVIAKIKGQIKYIPKENFFEEVGILGHSSTPVKVSEDTLRRLNQLKYMWNFKTQREVLIRLLEISDKYITADYVKEPSK